MKALSPILVTLSGITMEVRESQYSKAELPILVTPSGITMVVREEQPLKVLFPILVTPSGIIMEVREEKLPFGKLLKALSPILVTRYITPS